MNVRRTLFGTIELWIFEEKMNAFFCFWYIVVVVVVVVDVVGIVFVAVE